MAEESLDIPHPDSLKIQDITISTPLFRVLSQYVGYECDNICKVSVFSFLSSFFD